MLYVTPMRYYRLQMVVVMGKLDKVIMKFQLGNVRNIYRDAVEVAKQFDCAHVQFPFNGVNVVVNSWCDNELSTENFIKIHDAVGNDGEYIYL